MITLLSRRLLLGLLCALLLTCSEAPTSPSVPSTSEGMVPIASTTKSLRDSVIDGTLAGTVYRLFRPAGWNGRLILYAHGTIEPDAPIALPPETDSVIALAASRGAAVALSSFRENGWAVKDGGQRTAQLRGIFIARFGPPTHVYVAGGSQGGLIATMLAEEHPEVYAGALALCAPNAGLTANTAFVGNVRTLFDYFYPGVLPGNAASLPSDLDVDRDVVAPALAAMTADPAGAATIARFDQTPVPGATPDELARSVSTALYYHGLLLNDLLEATHGHPIFDNVAITYTGPLPGATLALINAGVGRYAGSPSGANYARHNYDPTGKLRIPLLAMYNTRDPAVPLFNHTAYRSLVAAQGASDLLVQRPIEGFGHCDFTADELRSAFDDLVNWAESGVRPEP
jgi:pimeloyl-ACP methyl ester carboxylesterase